MAQEFTDKNFEAEVLKSEVPVLVDFFAPWCGPCQIMAPIIDELAEEIKTIAKVGKLNVDENPEMSQKYQVMSIPTLKIFKNGQVVKEMQGVQNKEVLIEELKKI